MTPGQYLANYCRKNDITPIELATASGLARQRIHEILHDLRPLWPEAALRLAKAIRTTPEFLLDLQRDTDLAAAKEEEDLANVRRLP